MAQYTPIQLGLISEHQLNLPLNIQTAFDNNRPLFTPLTLPTHPTLSLAKLCLKV